MQKKVIILSAITAMLAVSTVFAGGTEIIPIIPNYFTGFFIGGTGSLHEAGFDANVSTTINPFTVSAVIPNNVAPIPVTASSGVVYTSNNPKGTSWDGFGGVQGGLGITVWNQLYLGVVGFGEWGKQTSSSSTNVNVPLNTLVAAGEARSDDFVGSSNTTVSTTTKVELSNDYGVYFKPGYLLTPTIMVYGKLGVIWATEKVTNSVQYNLNQTSSAEVPNPPNTPIIVASVTEQGTATGSSDSGNQTKTAFLLGGGVESFIFPQWFNHHVTLSADYSWANFGHVTTTTNVTGSATGVFIQTNSVTPTPPTTNSTPISGKTSATAAAMLNVLQGAVNFYFGNTLL